MKAVLCKALGPAANLKLEDLPSPEPGPQEAVVAVKAAGLNFFDTLIIEGKYQFKPDPPFSPAAEFAGIVKTVGEAVQTVRPGDRVMGYCGWGAAREEIAVAASALAPIPASISFEEAAGLIVTYGTTYHALHDRARLRSGETVAVLGASGGVGQAAIELGKAMGARVIACASSDDKLAVCRSLGADAVVNYSQGSLRDILKELTAGRGVEVVYDPVGGTLSEAALRATAWEGRFLVIGFASGTIPKIPLNLVLLKGCQIVGVFWGDHVAREPDKHRANMAKLAELCGAGRIRPRIDRLFPLEEAAAALGVLSRREAQGKVILVP
ncbi:MAG TPA: NADPH:quinone oxidoreductase family protein [Aestuariivirgaceae bacterium]|jgi:NADPH:quinone reductase|nr:NADPH:quinone oxidoreductase family protein [Aestuariivirgaceae bacterium]